MPAPRWARRSSSNHKPPSNTKGSTHTRTDHQAEPSPTPLESKLTCCLSSSACKRTCAAGLDAALYARHPQREYRRKLDGAQEARLAVLACSTPPEGHERWTLRLLADRLVEPEIVESVSYETVRQVLQQTASSRG